MKPRGFISSDFVFATYGDALVFFFFSALGLPGAGLIRFSGNNLGGWVGFDLRPGEALFRESSDLEPIDALRGLLFVGDLLDFTSKRFIEPS